MKKPQTENFGFTLIELLVVIFIIGLLSSIVLTSINAARVKARDARRLADVRQIATAIQFYYDDNNSFPSTAGCTGGWCCLGHGNAGTCWNGSYSGSTPLDNALSPRYIPRLPDDPLNNTSRFGDSYMYNASYPTSAGTGPVLHWGIEGANPVSRDCAGGDIGNWGPGGGNGGNYYCFLPIR
jgi:prepilin-type N-terminal cleavage/methylation domain-containing protein